MAKKRFPSLDAVRVDIEGAFVAWRSYAAEYGPWNDDWTACLEAQRERVIAFLDVVEQERELLRHALEACQAVAGATGTEDRVAAQALALGVVQMAKKPL